MSNPELGKLIEGKEQRDAIHIAVFPAEATERLYPGQEVGLVNLIDQTKVGSAGAPSIGIVDPYLKHHVENGDKFWVFLFPYTTTALKHHWEHPSFKNEKVEDLPPKEDTRLTEAKKIIQETADEAELSYKEMIDYANSHVLSGEYFCEGARWDGVGVCEEFWNAYEVVTGKKVKEEDRGGIFSCSC